MHQNWEKRINISVVEISILIHHFSLAHVLTCSLARLRFGARDDWNFDNKILTLWLDNRSLTEGFYLTRSANEVRSVRGNRTGSHASQSQGHFNCTSSAFETSSVNPPPIRILFTKGGTGRLKRETSKTFEVDDPSVNSSVLTRVRGWGCDVRNW